MREDDPLAVRLLADGWAVVARVVGRPADRAQGGAAGTDLEAWSRRSASGLDGGPWATRTPGASSSSTGRRSTDYPVDGCWTTSHTVPDERAPARQLSDDWHAYGARTPDGRLDCVTVMRPDADRVETEFTVTRAGVAGQGLATAVKAYGILDQVRRGNRTFGTGGSAATRRRCG